MKRRDFYEYPGKGSVGDKSNSIQEFETESHSPRKSWLGKKFPREWSDDFLNFVSGCWFRLLGGVFIGKARKQQVMQVGIALIWITYKNFMLTNFLTTLFL